MKQNWAKNLNWHFCRTNVEYGWLQSLLGKKEFLVEMTQVYEGFKVIVHYSCCELSLFVKFQKLFMTQRKIILISFLASKLTKKTKSYKKLIKTTLFRIILPVSNKRSFDKLSRDIHIECSKQFKWNSYFYVFGQNRPFWAALKLL